MRILGLDISTKTGFAVLDDDKLIDFGLLQTSASNDHSLEDFNIIARSTEASSRIHSLIFKYKPDFIFVEQTNAGRFRGSQKQLEFIHCLFLYEALKQSMQEKIYYVDTSKWRSTLNIRLSKDQRKHNKQVKQKVARGKITPKHLAVIWANDKYSLSLKKKDHDIADAIALCHFGFLSKNKKIVTSLSIEEVLQSK